MLNIIKIDNQVVCLTTSKKYMNYKKCTICEGFYSDFNGLITVENLYMNKCIKASTC